MNSLDIAAPAPISGHFRPTLSARLTTLAAGDRRILFAFVALALAPLALGVVFGVLTALARSGVTAPAADIAYRSLTLHASSAFFFWLGFAQATLIVALSVCENAAGLRMRRTLWAAIALLAAGFGVVEWAATTATPLLYDANPEVGIDDPFAVGAMAAGYLLLAGGLALAALAAIATALDGRSEDAPLSAGGFGVLAWGAFLIVSAAASTNAFGPNLAWALGFGGFPRDASTNWHILFHNLHYLPLMATVLVWYALTRDLTGVGSAFGANFSKVVFASYLVFVPPTSLYHMFLEPGLPEGVRVAGSLLSLFVSVPTLTAFVVIVSSLEISTKRASPATGLFGWMARLPWGEPAFAAIGVAMLSTLTGIVFAFVLIQEKFAPLISDTTFVPGYFHFFAVGSVSETFLAGLLTVAMALKGRAAPWPRLAAAMPWLVFAGLVAFGVGGVMAGFSGAPRRVFDMSYDGGAPASWVFWLDWLAIGGSVFAVGLGVQIASLVAVLAGYGGAPKPAVAEPGREATQTGAVAAWTGPLAVLVVVLAMSVATQYAFGLIADQPAIAGGHSGH